MKNVGEGIPEGRENMCKGSEIQVGKASQGIVGGSVNFQCRGWVAEG